MAFVEFSWHDDEAAELARFVAAAQAQRRASWRHVERLKANCAPKAPADPELNLLFIRLTRLEAELKASLREQRDRSLRHALETGSVAMRPFVRLPMRTGPAANADDYAKGA